MGLSKTDLNFISDNVRSQTLSPWRNDVAYRGTATNPVYCVGSDGVSYRSVAFSGVDDDGNNVGVGAVNPVGDATGTWALFIIANRPGDIVLSTDSTKTNDGFLETNGAAVSRTTYADLFAVIGETYGNGNGTTTFNLPNFSETIFSPRFIRNISLGSGSWTDLSYAKESIFFAVLDNTNNRFRTYTITGTIMDTVALGTGNWQAIAAEGEDARVFCLDTTGDGRVLGYEGTSLESTITLDAGSSVNYTGLISGDIDSFDEFQILDDQNNRIDLYGQGARQDDGVIPGVSRNTPDLTISRGGKYFVLDNTDNTVIEFSFIGDTILNSFPTTLGGTLVGIDTDAEHRVYVMQNNGSVEVFSNRGERIGLIPLGPGVFNGIGVSRDEEPLLFTLRVSDGVVSVYSIFNVESYFIKT